MPVIIDITQLHEELQTLREQVALLQQQVQRPQVALASSRPAPFLGQRVVLSGTVTAATGEPQVGASVVVVTTWGRLKSRGRLLTEQGTSLVVVTGAEGQFSVDLLPPTAEDLLAVQQAALELLLARLDATAATPRQTEAELREMAQLYQWDVNHAYRQALDIYFRDFGEGLLDSVNVRDYLQQWDYQEATVTAYVPKADSTAVDSLGVMMVPFKHWLGPWLEVFLALSQSQNPLPTMLDALQKTSPLGGLQEGVYRRVSDYVDSQSGIVGAYISRKVVAKTVQSFLLEGLDSVEDVEIKAALAPTLKVASGLLTVGGVSGLQSVVQTRRDLKLEVGNQIESGNLVVGDLTDRVAGMATQLSGLQTNLGTVDSRVGTLTTQVTGLQTTVGGIDGRVGTLTTQITDVQSNLGTVSGQVDTLQTRFSQIGNRMGTLEGRLTLNDERVGTVVGRVDGLTTTLEGLGDTVVSLDRALTDVVQGGLTTLNNRVSTLDNRVGVIDNRLGVIGRDITRLDSSVGTLQTNVNQFDTRLNTVSGQVGRLETNVSTLDTRFTNLNGRVLNLDGRFNTLNTQVGGLERNLGTLSRFSTDRIAVLENSISRVGNNVLSLRTDLSR